MADADDTRELFATEPAPQKRRKGRKLKLNIQRLPDEPKIDYLRRYARVRYNYLKAHDPSFLTENAARTAAYNKANPELAKQRKQEEVARNAVKYRQRAAKWYKEHPEQATATRKAWAEKNRDRVNELSKPVRHARRAKIKAGGRHTVADIQEIRRLQKDRCALCRIKLKNKGVTDHIIPIKLGGANDRKNIQLLCAPCNYRKNAKHPLKYARELGLLL